MNVNEKGVKGLIKVIDDLQEKGYYTFIPFDDHSPVDLVVIDRTGRVYRLQIKYRERAINKVSEKYELLASSVVCGKKVPINRDLIDGWGIYLANCKKVVYIHKGLMEGKTLHTIDPNVDYGDLKDWK